MIKKIVERGYAKINLHLDVTGRFDGGYHRVETVMQTVSLYDEITILLTETTDIRVSCNRSGIPLDERNLAVRAARLFAEKTGIYHGMQLTIQKNIPMAAGMAGGSTDGAAVLLGLNRLHGNPLSIEEICSLGSRLGADVPFCIVGGTLYADGKGDILHRFPELPDCLILCACEGEAVSTPWAYGLLDQKYGDFSEGCGYTPRGHESLRQALLKGDIHAIAAELFNIFEEPVLAERPVAAKIRELMIQNGAVRAMMSGSGPSVFAIFDSEEAREAARVALESEGYRAYSCRPVKSFEKT